MCFGYRYQVVGVHQRETLGWSNLLELDALAQAPLSVVAKKHKRIGLGARAA